MRKENEKLLDVEKMLNTKNSTCNCQLFTHSSTHTMAFAMRHRALTAAAAASLRGGGFINSATPSLLLSTPLASHRRALASSVAVGNPTDLCAQLVSYARHEWRRGERGTAVGVLEHGAELVARSVQGQEVTPEAAVAAARTHLAWAAMQAVRGIRIHPSIPSS
jgi:hypothetical protein